MKKRIMSPALILIIITSLAFQVVAAGTEPLLLSPKHKDYIGYKEYYGKKTLYNVRIPDGINQILDSAFAYCANLYSIEIPKSVTYIGEEAFFNCTSLMRVAIPEGTKVIVRGAFCACESLTSLAIPSSVVTIGAAAFGDCPNLRNVYYAGTKEQWKELKANCAFGNESVWDAAVHYSSAGIPAGESDAGGTAAGDFYATDIVTTLNGYQIGAINVGGKTLICAEDMARHSFTVKWSAANRTLKVSRNNVPASGSAVSSSGGRVGERIGKYYPTDIITYLDGREISAWNTGGRTYICAEDMANYGYYVVWSSASRTLTIRTP